MWAVLVFFFLLDIIHALDLMHPTHTVWAWPCALIWLMNHELPSSVLDVFAWFGFAAYLFFCQPEEKQAICRLK